MRSIILNHLINLDKPIDEIEKSLKALDWDSDEKTLMSKESVKLIIAKYIINNVDLETLEKWANTIEGREDIDYDDSCSREIKQLIFNIANQDIQGLFSKEIAIQWLDKFNSAASE